MSCKELTFVRNLPSHIFDLKVEDDWILYSNWLEHSIMAISMATGQQEVLVKGLMRPTMFVVQSFFHPGKAICVNIKGFRMSAMTRHAIEECTDAQKNVMYYCPLSWY